MKSCLLAFLVLNCLSRMTFFLGWTIDGPTCEPSMIQSDARWISYLSNIPAAFFVSAFSILVSSFVGVYHDHVSSVDWKNVFYHRGVVGFIILVNVGLYTLLAGSIVGMARHDTDTTFQHTLTIYLTVSSSLMAVLFFVYGRVLYTAVRGVMASQSDAQDLYADMAALDVGGDSPHSHSRLGPGPGRRSSVLGNPALPPHLQHPGRVPMSSTHADLLLDRHSDVSYVVADGTPRHGHPHHRYSHSRSRNSPASASTTSHPPPQLHGASHDAQSLHSEDTGLASTPSYPSLSDARVESSGQLSSLTHAAQHARAKLANSQKQKKCLTVQLGASVRGAQTPSTSRTMSAYSTMDPSGSASTMPDMDDMHPSLPALPRPAGVGAGVGSSSGDAWIGGGVDPNQLDAMTLSISTDRLSQGSRNTFTAHDEPNPMARMYHISIISSICLLWRVAMLILMAVLDLKQGPAVIIVYSLASEIIPVHLILRVFNDTSANYTRDLADMETDTPAISQDRNPESLSVSTEDVSSAYQYQPPMYQRMPINRT
jgi:hypothetical protein